MSPRVVGSGRYGRTASAIEELLAATLEGNSTRIRVWRRALDNEAARGWCPIPPARMQRWVASVCSKLALPVASASRLVAGGHTDVLAFLRGGGQVPFEVKAQTTKTYQQITEADWVRHDTDFLRLLTYRNDPAIQHFHPGILQRLAVSGHRYFANLGFEELLLADLALLPDASTRALAGVTDRSSLERYLASKYLFQLSTQGARAAHLESLALVRHILGGGSVSLVPRRNAVGFGIWVISRGDSLPDFSYHSYNDVRLGRHKFHARGVGTPRWVEA